MNNITPTDSLQHWRPPPIPDREPLTGRYCSLSPLNVEHAEALFNAYTTDHADQHWLYLPYGPFLSVSDFTRWVASCAESEDTHFYCVSLKDFNNKQAVMLPAGITSYLRIKPDSGSIEVGHIHYSSLLKNTRAATEAMYLMMSLVFALGYRRYEWKCDALNVPSRSAADRLGFTFEGIFRQATVVKGRNRDTAWFSMLDHEWPALKRGYHRWLDDSNFDSTGAQIERLKECFKQTA